MMFLLTIVSALTIIGKQYSFDNANCRMGLMVLMPGDADVVASQLVNIGRSLQMLYTPPTPSTNQRRTYG